MFAVLHKAGWLYFITCVQDTGHWGFFPTANNITLLNKGLLSPNEDISCDKRHFKQHIKSLQ